jgi:hypothetical protein
MQTGSRIIHLVSKLTQYLCCRIIPNRLRLPNNKHRVFGILEYNIQNCIFIYEIPALSKILNGTRPYKQQRKRVKYNEC